MKKIICFFIGHHFTNKFMGGRKANKFELNYYSRNSFYSYREMVCKRCNKKFDK
jgi:hypothetical protein